MKYVLVFLFLIMAFTGPGMLFIGSLSGNVASIHVFGYEITGYNVTSLFMFITLLVYAFSFYPDKD